MATRNLLSCDGDGMGIVYHIEGTSDIACVASVSAWFGSKEFQGVHGVSKRGGASKIPKIPFLSLSLLPNPTETLATQATSDNKRRHQKHHKIRRKLLCLLN